MYVIINPMPLLGNFIDKFCTGAYEFCSFVLFSSLFWNVVQNIVIRPIIVHLFV
jgi:hypothetical protein